jgi:hypothetical protein
LALLTRDHEIFQQWFDTKGMIPITFRQEHAPGVQWVDHGGNIRRFPPAGGRALEVVFMAAVGDIGDRLYLP